MNKKEWIKLGLSVLVALLLVLVIISVMSLEKTKEDIDVKLKNPIKEETEFQNESTMEEKDIRILVEEKRITLKNFFQNAKYYTISEVSKNHTKEDDENYIVVNEEFLNDLKNLYGKKRYF